VKGVEPKSPYSVTEYTYAEADGNPLKIHMFRPEVAKGKLTPCLICFAGSGFGGVGGPRVGAATYFVDHGYTVVACPYRGSWVGGATFPTPLHECIAAIRYLRNNSADLGIDPNKIASYGGSSGGWTALMLAVSGSEKFKDEGLLGAVGPAELQAVPSTVCCAIDNFGPTDFAAMDSQRITTQVGGKGAKWHDTDSPETRFLSVSNLQDDLKLNAKASPLTYLEPGLTPPIYVSHGDLDLLVPHGQSRLLVEKLKALGITHEYNEVAGAGHGDEAFSSEIECEKVLSFLKKHCHSE